MLTRLNWQPCPSESGQVWRAVASDKYQDRYDLIVKRHSQEDYSVEAMHIYDGQEVRSWYVTTTPMKAMSIFAIRDGVLVGPCIDQDHAIGTSVGTQNEQ